MTEITGLLFEVVSIQKYVFGGNRFRENSGASYIISELIYKEWLREIVAEGFGVLPDDASLCFSEWRKSSPDMAIKKESCNAEVIWEAGGVCCIWLKGDEEFAGKIVRRFSAELLVKAPGLKLCAVAGKVSLENIASDFSKWIKEMFAKGRKVRERGLPVCSFPNPGVSLPCGRTGATAETKLEKDWVSSEVFVKDYFSESANESLRFKYLNDGVYKFPLDFGEMGQKKGENNHIAIVHVDGDGIGKIFREVRSVAESRALSELLRYFFETAFKEVCRLSINVMESVDKLQKERDETQKPWEQKEAEWQKEAGEQKETGEKRFFFKDKVLPLRPLLIGGDDITFVTEGRLGIYFAIRYLMELRRLTEKKITEFEQLKNFTASAAVVITGTKFPFWQGYQLTEDVCAQAKKRSKALRAKGKYEWFIDFHINRGTATTDLEHLRRHHFTSPQGNLLYRPVSLDGRSDDRLNMIQLIAAASKMSAWPNSVVHGLRDALYRSGESEQEFLQQQGLQNRKLADFRLDDPFDNRFFGGQEPETPYMDIVELLEFLPPEPIPDLLLKELKGEGK